MLITRDALPQGLIEGRERGRDGGRKEGVGERGSEGGVGGAPITSSRTGSPLPGGRKKVNAPRI